MALADRIRDEARNRAERSRIENKRLEELKQARKEGREDVLFFVVFGGAYITICTVVFVIGALFI